MRRPIKNITRICLVAVAVLTLGLSCSKYDGPDNYHYWDYGMLYLAGDSDEINEKDREYYIVRDDGIILYIKYNNWHQEVPPNRRVYFNYVVLEKVAETRNGKQDLVVHIYYISDVRSKDVINFSDIQAGEKEVGSDPVLDISMNLSGKFLNVIYEYPTEYPRKEGVDDNHSLDVVIDDVNLNDDEITVYLCHNAHGDTPVDKGKVPFISQKARELSFDLSSIIPEGKKSVMVKFEWKAYNNKDYNAAVKTVTKKIKFEPGINTTKLVVKAPNTDNVPYPFTDK